MAWFRAKMCLLEIPKTEFHISTIFPPQNANIGTIFDGAGNFGSKRPNNDDAYQ